MLPPPSIDIESEMNRFMPEIGGSLVSSFAGCNAQFANADYFFREENIVAELKCLSEDKSSDERQHRAILNLFENYVRRGLITDPGAPTIKINSVDYPKEFQRDLYCIIAKPIRWHVEKANRQIRETKNALSRSTAHGLLLLANDGNFRLEPDQLMYALDLTLGDRFSSIDSVIVFTENMLTTTRGFDLHIAPIVPASRKGHAELSKSFFDRFVTGWSRHTSSLYGREIRVFRDIETGHLGSLRYDRVVSSNRYRNRKK
jgi:hypothetical protein